MKILNYFQKNDGITLVELLVTLAILGVVAGLGTMVYVQANQAFDAAEEKWQVQTEMRRLATVINNNLKNSYGLTIDPDNFESSLNDADRYLYLKDNDNNGYGEIRYKYKDKNSQKIIDKVIIGQDGGQHEYKVEWSKENDDSAKVLSYYISSTFTNYELNSKIYLSNMAKQSGISGPNESINGIFFSSSDLPFVSIDTNTNTFCFIATAAYGSSFNPAVKTLRMFRDLYLSKFELGQKFISLYYQYSPKYAEIISSNNFLRLFVNILLLPLVLLSFLFIIKEISFLIITYVGILIIFAVKLNLYIKFKKERC